MWITFMARKRNLSLRLTVAIGLLTFAASVPAATDCFKKESDRHPIDIWEAREMKKTGGVTVSIRNVQNQVYQKWDKELNRLYQELMSRLSEDKKLILRESQRNWIKFRDAEYDLLNHGIYTQGGTLSTVVVGTLGKDIVRTRTLQLKFHLRALDCPP